ncbi:MAG: hypothetical protein HZA51_02890 [Planctomycetes bacterium]|nr:hypothetical protein [Planctomycetota bacterium]
MQRGVGLFAEETGDEGGDVGVGDDAFAGKVEGAEGGGDGGEDHEAVEVALRALLLCIKK